MKAFNIVTLVLVIVGAVNWGLVGLFQFDLVAALFGGQQTALARLVYVLVGAAGIFQVVMLMRLLSGETDDSQRTANIHR
ncbi:DUF378 domain-containing protein [Microvirga zambiensis]|uniref:DUF378 domain-containing protein n=1 Tax=Microvirga zambiensis TaxID=1402137 RepID=UPI00191D0C08|nr:DUF378 domain-containing protein [Microvirga zambiensis]